MMRQQGERLKEEREEKRESKDDAQGGTSLGGDGEDEGEKCLRGVYEGEKLQKKVRKETMMKGEVVELK